jgi:hypothetical protein
VISRPFLPVKHRSVAMAGWVLYVLSWLTPDAAGNQFGAQVFVRSAVVGGRLAVDHGHMTSMLVGVSLLCGWLANFSIFFRWPAVVRFVWIAVPWMPFVALLLVAQGPVVFTQLYFYPWAVGIGLIHAAQAADTRNRGLV